MAGRAKRSVGKAKPKNNISFNRENAIRLNDLLIAAHKEKKGVFGYEGFTIAPECDAVAAIDDPLSAARLLFYAISTDQRNKSERLYPLYRAAYEKDPRNVDPAHLYTLPFDEFRAHFNRHFKVNVKQIVEGTYRSTAVLHTEYDNDPRKFFDGITDVHEALKKLSVDEETKLLGKQMGKLLIKNYIEKGLVSFDNAEEHPPKVDTWNTRISIATCIVEFAEPGWYHSWSIVDVLDKGWEQVCKAHKVNGMQLNNIIWALGSNVCVRQDRRACYASRCPLYETQCDNFPNSYDAGGQILVGVDVRKEHGDFIFHEVIEALQPHRLKKTRVYTMPSFTSHTDQNKLF